MKIVYLLFAVTFALLNITDALACTGIQLKSTDGAIINGRTVEFGLDLHLGGIIVPRNYSFHGTLPNGGAGLSYRSKYAALGGSMFGENAIADGINEKGLAIGDFYFPDYAQYAAITPSNQSHALSPTEFSNWILTQFATVEEVKEGIKSVVIAPTTPKGWPTLPPFHYIVYDRTGKSIVIEPINGQLKVYDNPLGVITNSPTFDWHMTNLGNYINLSPINSPPVNIDGVKLKQFGEGSGMHGLPGDFTPPSRFVRAAIFSTAAMPTENAIKTVLQVFHILNQFDIPFGAVRQMEGKTTYPEYTLATIVRDLRNLKFYFKTYDDQAIKMVTLSGHDFNSKEIKHFVINGPQQIIDVTRTEK